MTEVELDLAGSEVYEAVKTFLTHCPSGSQESASSTALDSVKEKYKISSYEYRKLVNIANMTYSDITRKSRANISVGSKGGFGGGRKYDEKRK